MVYKKRYDNRKFDELRKIEAKAGVIPKADGSAYFKIGKTVAYAAVYGPRELHPRFMQNPKKGVLRCTYNMMPFSGMGERVRPGPNRRAKEISMVTKKALSPVVNLDDYPNAVVDVFIELPETDAGSRCAGISAASIALADAGLQMKDMVAAVAVGYVDGQLVTDLSYEEEATEPATDLPVAFVPSTGELSLLQMDGEINAKELEDALKAGKLACEKIAKVQQEALQARFAKPAKSAKTTKAPVKKGDKK